MFIESNPDFFGLKEVGFAVEFFCWSDPAEVAA